MGQKVICLLLLLDSFSKAPVHLRILHLLLVLNDLEGLVGGRRLLLLVLIVDLLNDVAVARVSVDFLLFRQIFALLVSQFASEALNDKFAGKCISGVQVRSHERLVRDERVADAAEQGNFFVFGKRVNLAKLLDFLVFLSLTTV